MSLAYFANSFQLHHYQMISNIKSDSNIDRTHYINLDSPIKIGGNELSEQTALYFPVLLLLCWQNAKAANKCT